MLHELTPKELFEKLALEHLKDLLGSALRMTRNWEDAQDLTQDTLVRAFRGFRSFRPGTNFRAWVFRILINTYINNQRKKSRQPKTTPLEVDTSHRDGWAMSEDRFEERVSDNGGAEKEVLARVPFEELQSALDDLPDEFRIAVLLSDVEGMPYKEIAQLLHIPLGTVRSRIFRGRNLLRDQVAQKPEDRKRKHRPKRIKR